MRPPKVLICHFCGKKICSLYERRSVPKPVFRVRHFCFMPRTFNTLLFLKLYYNNNRNQLRKGVRQMKRVKVEIEMDVDVVAQVRQFLGLPKEYETAAEVVTEMFYLHEEGFAATDLRHKVTVTAKN